MTTSNGITNEDSKNGSIEMRETVTQSKHLCCHIPVYNVHLHFNSFNHEKTLHTVTYKASLLQYVLT